MLRQSLVFQHEIQLPNLVAVSLANLSTILYYEAASPECKYVHFCAIVPFLYLELPRQHLQPYTK
ncbi:hypothetical protein D3C76_1854650 [compost metagenome]